MAPSFKELRMDCSHFIQWLGGKLRAKQLEFKVPGVQGIEMSPMQLIHNMWKLHCIDPLKKSEFNAFLVCPLHTRLYLLKPNIQSIWLHIHKRTCLPKGNLKTKHCTLWTTFGSHII